MLLLLPPNTVVFDEFVRYRQSSIYAHMNERTNERMNEGAYSWAMCSYCAMVSGVVAVSWAASSEASSCSAR